MKIILLAGAPGSGKSTQGSALMAMNDKFKHISAGEIVRDILKDPNHPITRNYQDLISRGELLPDAVILEILDNELKKLPDQNTIVLLDGYPRSETQYETFKEKWGQPAGLIHLDIEKSVLSSRMQNRGDSRSDDNDKAIEKRLLAYQETTEPLIKKMKSELKKNAMTINHHNSVQTTSLLIYSKLQRIPEIHDLLKKEFLNDNPKPMKDPTIKPIWALSLFSQLWQKENEYTAIDEIQKNYQTSNFSFSLPGKNVVYLETAPEVKAVLEARSQLGHVYRHFSLAAGLKHDFVATDVNNPHSYKLDNGEVNVWKLIHNAFSLAVKQDRFRIETLIDKHLNQTFFAEKTFDLDTTFDAFFTSFWSDYLFGKQVSSIEYRQTREILLTAMRYCFYDNQYKSLDPTGLSSLYFSYDVENQLQLAKNKLAEFVNRATPDSLAYRFKLALDKLNSIEELRLDNETIMQIVADNVFDFIIEPDFLENVMYEALVSAIKDNADLRNHATRQQVYNQGILHGYLFPIRSRILDESIVLPNGNELPAGSMVYVNLKRAGIYHSAGARRCVGQAYTHYFKEHFFNRLESIEFKVKDITEPSERHSQSNNPNIPVSPERYQVSWHLKRDEAMRHLSFHNYKGNKFFDVLSLHQNPGLNSHMVKQLTLIISRFLEKNSIELNDVVIVTPEVRGIPIAAQVADRLQLPLYTIRKKGGYKMDAAEVYSEAYDKGYGDTDEIEIPKEKMKLLAGKKVIFLDDGLASGNSALACVKLIETNGEDEKNAAEVIMVLTLLKHDYVNTDPRLSEHRLVKTLFDCKCNVVQEKLPMPDQNIRFSL